MLPTDDRVREVCFTARMEQEFSNYIRTSGIRTSTRGILSGIWNDTCRRPLLIPHQIIHIFNNLKSSGTII